MEYTYYIILYRIHSVPLGSLTAKDQKGTAG